MGDSKQVRLDNWGTYFLQKLQHFFNKTDYCDLTLQFEGNVQLKVHRLVMSACTEYFHILEQTCEMCDDILIMPPDLQADVILPIVNFMYTGILEFQLSTFDKLYRTAELMNIPVLIKLLEAQRKPIGLSSSKPKSRSVSSTPNWTPPTTKKTSIKNLESELPTTLPGRKCPIWKRKIISSQPPALPVYESKFKSEPSYDNAPKPTRFEWPDEDSTMFNLMDTSFNDISYTSKPLLTQEEELRAIATASATFDDIKHLPDQNKKPNEYSSTNIDIEEIKDYVKEQRIRSDLVEEEDEDADNDLECYEQLKAESNKRKLENPDGIQAKRVRFNTTEKENKELKLNVSHTGKNADLNHTKIIQEVLKKYPHLVKKNKNIRLKILAKGAKGSDILKSDNINENKNIVDPTKQTFSVVKQETRKEDEGPWECTQCTQNGEPTQFVLYYLYRKHMSEVHQEKFDSRMCKYCGHMSTKHNMLMYHQYTKHGMKPPPAYNFPKCNQCPYIALTEALLIKHKKNHTKYDFECTECKLVFNNINSLHSHMQITAHTGKNNRNNFDCQYCTKRLTTGAELFSHLKMRHKDEARRDGVVSIDESDPLDDSTESEVQEQEENQKVIENPKEIKILSNLKFEPQDSKDTGSTITLEPSSEAEALSNVASGIATSLGLVDIVVLDENQQYILHSNDQQIVTPQNLANATTEYMLPELTDSHNFTTNQTISEVITADHHNVITQSMLNNSDIGSTDELVMVLTDHDYNDGTSEILNNDNSNIVVLYSHPVDGQENQYITSQGNIMINSQTGMLEIRNAIPTTAANQLVINAQDTPIESIEMIQEEINSHAVKKVDNLSKETLVTSTSMNMPSTMEPLINNTDILASEMNEQVTSVPVLLPTTESLVYSSMRNIELEQGNIEVGTKLTSEENLSEYQEDVIDSNEKLATIEEKDENEEGVHLDNANLETPMEVDEEEVSAEQNKDEKQENFEDKSRELEKKNVFEEREGNDLQEKNGGDLGTCEESNSQEVHVNLQEKMQEPYQHDESDELSAKEVNKYISNKENQEYLPEPMEVDGRQNTMAIDEGQTNLLFQDEKRDAESKENNEELKRKGEVYHQENKPGHQENSFIPIEDVSQIPLPGEVIPENNINVQIEENKDAEEQIKENIEICTEIENIEIKQEENTTKSTYHENKEENIPPENKLEYIKEEDNLQKDNSEESQNKQSLENQTKENFQETESAENFSSISEQKQQTSQENLEISGEEVRPNSPTEVVQKTYQIEIEECSQEESQIDEESFQSQDDTSQMSPKSRFSKTPPVEMRRESSENTKIAILDDWEDTDSQSSDHGGIREAKSAVNVHKIIDDWDDDDDESKK